MIVALITMNDTKSVSKKIEKLLIDADYIKAYELAEKDEKAIVANESVVAHYIAELIGKGFVKDDELESAWIDRDNRKLVIQAKDKYYLFAVQNNFGGYQYIDVYTGDLDKDATTTETQNAMFFGKTDWKQYSQNEEIALEKEINSIISEKTELPVDSIYRINDLKKENKLDSANEIKMVGNKQ